MKSNPRPRKYASDAERQAAFRARNVLVEFRAEPKTADKLTEIAAAIDVSRSDLLLSMVKFALTNHDWARFGLTHKTIPLYQGNPIMATKKASPAQIAARKRFAEMARSGELAKTRKKTVKKNPAAEREMSSTNKERPNYRVVVTNRNSPDYFYLSESGAVNEAKQLSRLDGVGEVYKNMTKRGAFKWEPIYWFDSTGVYPAGSEGQANTRINPSARKNPTTKKLYTVHRADAKGAPVYHIAHFTKQADAKQYAQAYADLHKTPVAITSKAM